MAYSVRVQLKSSKSPVHGSPVDTREEAEQQVEEVRRTLGTEEKPEVPGLAVVGNDIVSADVVEVTEPGAERRYDLAVVEQALRMAEEVIRADDERERDD